MFHKTLIIVDDHPLLRDGLKSIIDRDTRFEVVGEAGSYAGAINLINKNKPNLAVVDISLPDRNGIELASAILEISPDTGILMVSAHSKISYITEAFKAGAKGYISKDSASTKLLEGLEAIALGEHYMDGSISFKVLKKLTNSLDDEENFTDNSYKTLTSREQEVMRLLAEGLSNKQIAKKLFISPKTVENHRSNIMKKLDLKGIVELVHYAAKLGLIDFDS